jgi:hypothetical protein
MFRTWRRWGRRGRRRWWRRIVNRRVVNGKY